MQLLARALVYTKNVVAVVGALRENGYGVLTRICDDAPAYTFIEAYRDVCVIRRFTSLGKTLLFLLPEHNVYTSASAELDRVNDIIEPYGGGANDCGPPPADHVPFQYETPAWRERPTRLAE
jgi:hypothetical protein